MASTGCGNCANCSGHGVPETEPAGEGYFLKIDQKEILRTSNVWNVPNTDKRLCNNSDKCQNIALFTCSRCRFHKYCSKVCQKTAWRQHKHECTKYEAEPVHTIVGVEPGQPNYFKCLRTPGTWDRPNIFIQIEETSEPMKIFEQVFTRQWAHYQHRIGFFGDARFAKTMIVFKNKEDSRSFFEMFRTGASQIIGREEFDGMVEMIDESTSAETRQAIIEDWDRPESKVRMLITSPIDDDELVAPDVENLVVFEVENPKRFATRWQRMARMSGQQGTYLAITPSDELLVNSHFGQIPEELNPNAWRPKTWQLDRHRICENMLMSRGIPKEKLKEVTLDHLCDAIYRDEAYFQNGKLLFKT